LAKHEPPISWALRERRRRGGKGREREREREKKRERMMGFEPTTFCMASRRSSQLSYIRKSTQYSQA
jgi:hypothetical protein